MNNKNANAKNTIKTKTTIPTTTLPIASYGTKTLALSNDSFEFMLCYNTVNECYNATDKKTIDSDYMLYIFPYPRSFGDFNVLFVILGFFVIVAYGITLIVLVVFGFITLINRGKRK